MIHSISEWQHKIANAANTKFPGNIKWSQLDRLASIGRQLDDVTNAVKVENGLIQSSHHAHQDVNHRIAALIADILILADMRDADVEMELGKVLAWFEDIESK